MAAMVARWSVTIVAGRVIWPETVIRGTAAGTGITAGAADADMAAAVGPAVVADMAGGFVTTAAKAAILREIAQMNRNDNLDLPCLLERLDWHKVSSS